METTAKTQSDVLEGMLRAAATLVREEPTVAGFEGLAESGLFDEMPAGLEDDCLANGFALLAAELREHAGDADYVGELQREWLRLFAGVGEPQVPSWSNYYLDPESRVLGAETIAVRALYRRHGLQAEHAGAEPDDDLGLMLRFLAYLLKAGGSDAAGVADAEPDARELLARHVLPWMPRWHYLGLKYASSAFYRGVVEFTFGTVRLVASDLGFSYQESSRSFVQRKEMK